MKVESLTYDIKTKKWSAPLPTALDSDRTLLFVVGPVDLVDDPQSLAELVRAFPRSHVIGCGADGTVVGKGVRDDVVSITITQFEKTTMSVAQYGPTPEAFTAGQIIAKKLSKPSLRAILVLADGLEVNGAELVRGLNSSLDQSVAVIGGLAGDGTRYKRTWVLSGSSIKSGLAVGVGLYGDHVVVGHSTRAGWSKIGTELPVTKSDGAVIYEIDGRPAAKVYEEIVALAAKKSGAKSSLAIPLAVRASARHDKSLIRSVLSVDPEKQSLRLATDVPPGYLVQGVAGTGAELVSAAREAGAATKDSAAPVGATSLVLAVSHVGRRVQLESNASDEIAAAVDALPAGPKAHVAGFYGYGEIAPVGEGHADFHNQSLTMAVVMESPTPIARKATRGLAAGAARAQAPATAAGPAAHLRSRHQTVDDLFKELEIEGGKRGGRGGIPGVVGGATASAAGANVPPPVPPPRRLTPAPPPPGGSAESVESKIASSRPAEMRGGIDSGPRSRQKTPYVVDVPRDVMTQTTPGLGGAAVATAPAQAPATSNRGTVDVRSFSYDARASRWSTALPELDSEKTLVLAFGVPILGATAAPLDELVRMYPRSHVLGCASSRVIRAGSVADSGLVVTVARFSKTTLETAWSDLTAGALAAGDAIGRQLARPDLRAILVFADGSADGDALTRGLQATLPAHVTVAGGLAADDSGRRWVMSGANVRPGIAVAVGLYGNHLVLGHSSRCGFDAFGPERRITRSTGRTLFELDGRPALAVYSEYLGPRAAALRPGAIDLPFPLGLRVGKGPETVVRMPLSFDAASQSMTFAGELPKDSVVRLLRANHEHLLAEGSAAATAAGKPLSALPSDALVLAVSSIGRARALGSRAEEEGEGVVLSLPRHTRPHVVGFYSMAELATPGPGKAEIQNESIALTVLSEAAEVVTVKDAPSERRTIPAPPTHPAETPSPPAVLPTSSRVPKKRMEITRPVLSGVAATTGASAAARVTMAKAGDITVVSIAGRLSESFKGDTVGRELSGTVVFDLGGVERITSFGVREWLQMLATLQDRAKKVYFAQCSEAVVNQLSMIRKFAGNAQVVSFFAPYLCDSCGEQFERLFDCELDAEPLRLNEMPDSVCQRCSGRGRFDDDADTYLAFTPNHLGQPVPAEVRSALEEMAAAAPAPSPDLVDKSIEGETTRVRVQSKAGGAIRWGRILDGIEGALVIDLGGVAVLDDAGVASFEQALNALGDEVASVHIERSPQAVVDRFALNGVPRRVSIASTVLTGFCTSCNVQRPALLVTDQHAVAIATGREPTLHCKRCNGTLSLVGAETALSVLARHRKRNSQAPRTSTPPPAMARSGAPPSIPTLTARPSLMPVIPAPGAVPPFGPSFGPGALPQAAPAESSARPLVIAGALSLVILLAAGGFFVYARQRTPPTEVPPATPTAPASGWAQAVDLPPPWVERLFSEENGMFLVVGRSERAANADAALTQARNDAIARITRQLQADLGPPIQDFVAARAKDEEVRKRPAQVAERYLKQIGTFAQPERTETVVRQREGGVEAVARYRLPKSAYTQALALYRGTSYFQGVTVARIFPSFDAPPDAELVVLNVLRGRVGDLAGLKAGDYVVSAGNKPLSSVEAFAKLESDFAPLAPGNALELVVESGGNRHPTKLRKPYPYVGPAPVNPTPAPQPAPKDTRPKENKDGLGIIPPPRPF